MTSECIQAVILVMNYCAYAGYQYDELGRIHLELEGGKGDFEIEFVGYTEEREKQAKVYNDVGGTEQMTGMRSCDTIPEAEARPHLLVGQALSEESEQALALAASAVQVPVADYAWDTLGLTSTSKSYYFR